jgi:3'(2'), 5'-bisphosphate nucleotidase
MTSADMTSAGMTSAGTASAGMTPAEIAGLLPAVEAAVRQAAAVVMQVYGGAFEVQHKSDASPVTVADQLAEAVIVAALHKLTPDIAVVAEEAASQAESKGDAPADLGNCFWLVDPLDGTREFVSRNGEFTVNVALVQGGVPVLGVVYIPVQDRLFAGVCVPGHEAAHEAANEAGHGAWVVDGNKPRRAIRCRLPPATGPVLACSRSHGDDAAMAAWLAQNLPGQVMGGRIAVGSSLKFGLIAAGEADIYPRLGPTMEWDTAAGHAVLCAAGGQVLTLQGQPLRYGRAGHRNPHFVAVGLRQR